MPPGWPNHEAVVSIDHTRQPETMDEPHQLDPCEMSIKEFFPE